MKQSLKDVIDVAMLQSVLDNFSAATGMASVAVTSDGENLTNPSCFTEFCMDCTRGTREGMRRCVACDIKGGEESARTGKPAVYYCHAGLMDFGAPIIIDGELAGSVLGGQVLPKTPKEADFVRIARELGTDEHRYIEALRKISIVPEKRIRAAAQLLYIIVNEMASRWTQIFRIEKDVETIRLGLENIQNALNDFFEEFDHIIDNQAELSEVIEKIDADLSQINSVVKSVSRLADNTQLLGVNASIEASRAGAFGSGFSVVAKEISSLSEKSKDTIHEIEDFTSNIGKKVKETTGISVRNRSTLAADKQKIKEIGATLEALKQNFSELYQAVKNI